MLPIIEDVQFDQNPDRLKVTLPVQRNWPLFILFTVLVFIWVIGLIWGIVFTIRDVAMSGERFAFAFTVMLLVWLYIWYRLGQVVWNRWQYYTAAREILFIDKERLILRRPVSILGLTEAFDMQYVTPFYLSEKHGCVAFDYGHQHVYFGYSLEEPSARRLALALNRLCFPDRDDDDE